MRSKSALKKEVTLPKVHLLIVLVLCLAAGALAFRYGEDRGRDTGYASGYSAGYEEAPKRGFMDDFYKDETEKLTAEYNKLVDDYNTLRNNVLQYVNANQYQARQQLNCTSYNYGINDQFTSTNCY